MNLESSVWVVETQFSEIQEIFGKTELISLLLVNAKKKMLKNDFKLRIERPCLNRSVSAGRQRAAGIAKNEPLQ